jgi:membrane complex biogenesis BtpA family protein
MYHKKLSHKFIIGMLYLLPTKGKIKYQGEKKFLDHVEREAKKLFASGVDGILVENEFDHPYDLYADEIVIESMTLACKHLRMMYPVKFLGVEFLLNDPKASLKIAKDSKMDFIRTDYFVDLMSREEYGGEMKIDPVGVMQYREDIVASDIKVFTDIQVKYAKMLIDRSITESANLAVTYKSDGLIISSHTTGVEPNLNDLKNAKVSNVPVIVGSGLSIENIEAIFPYMDGAIVGSSMMDDGIVNEKKAVAFMDKVRRLRDEKL